MGMASRRTTSTTCSTPSSCSAPPRRHRPQEPGVLDGRRSARVRRLPQPAVKPALALSLHTTRAELRARLLPQARRPSPRRAGRTAEHYAKKHRLPNPVPWTLLEGINDSQEEMDGIVRLLSRQVRGHEPDPLQHQWTARVSLRPDWEAPRRAFPASSRHPHQAATLGRPGMWTAAAGSCGRGNITMVRRPATKRPRSSPRQAGCGVAPRRRSESYQHFKHGDRDMGAQTRPGQAVSIVVYRWAGEWGPSR